MGVFSGLSYRVGLTYILRSYGYHITVNKLKNDFSPKLAIVATNLKVVSLFHFTRYRCLKFELFHSSLMEITKWNAIWKWKVNGCYCCSFQYTHAKYHIMNFLSAHLNKLCEILPLAPTTSKQHLVYCTHAGQFPKHKHLFQ